MSVTIRVKRGTATQWAARTTALLSGEIGYDLTNKITKIGDGTTLWASLPSIDSSGGSNTGDVTFDGVQVIGAGTASGDGYGLGTLELVPDGDITSDQYLIIDPTAPNHIHIRSGGVQDASTADLFIGGERNNVRVSDGGRSVSVSTRPNTVINTYTNQNTISNTSFVTSNTANIYIGDTLFYVGGDIVTVDSITQDSPSAGLQTITANLNGAPASFVAGEPHIFSHEEEWENYWQFGADGVLSGPAMGGLKVLGLLNSGDNDLGLYANDADIYLQASSGAVTIAAPEVTITSNAVPSSVNINTYSGATINSARTSGYSDADKVVATLGDLPTQISGFLSPNETLSIDNLGIQIKVDPLNANYYSIHVASLSGSNTYYFTNTQVLAGDVISSNPTSSVGTLNTTTTYQKVVNQYLNPVAIPGATQVVTLADAINEKVYRVTLTTTNSITRFPVLIQKIIG